MEKGKEYPKDTVKQTPDFEERQKLQKIAGEVVERLLKDETIKAFEKAGYEEKDGYLCMVAASYDDSNKPQEVGKGTEESKINLKIAKTKKANPAGITPVAYFQKELVEGAKRLINELQLEIEGKNLHITYKNTEAAAFFPKSDGPTYKPNKLNAKRTFTNISDSKKFEKELRDFFAELAEEEVKYVTGSKIGVQDKTEKKMTDSIVQEMKEKRFNMSLSEIVNGEVDAISKKLHESTSEEKKDDVQPDDVEPSGTDQTPTGKPTDKNLLLGMAEEEKEKNEKVDEITTTTPGGAATIGGGSQGDPVNDRKDTQAGDYMYATPKAFKSGDDKQKVDDGYPVVTADENNQPKKEYTSNLQEKFDRTPYGEALKGRAHAIKESANSGWVTVPLGPNGYAPKGMEHNWVMGAPGGPNTPDAPPNSKEELKQTGHGHLSKLEKEEKEKKETLKEVFNRVRRPTATSSEPGDVTKRYIVDEKPTQEQLNERWNQLINKKSFDTIQDGGVIAIVKGDNKEMVSREEGEAENNKEFEGMNSETSLNSVPGCGCGEDVIDVPKDSTGIVVYGFKKAALNENKAYLVDQYTGKLVKNPLFKISENTEEKKENLDFSIYGKKAKSIGD